jgi:hypothetical protein
VLGSLLEPLEQWRRVAPRAAADEGNKTSGDLQNNQKRSKQLILVFLSFLFMDLFVSILDLFFSWFLLLLCLRRPAGKWASVDGCAATGGQSVQRRAGRGRRG